MRAYDRTNVLAQILRGEAPCTKVYEDEFALAFENNRPAAPVHVLVVPKASTCRPPISPLLRRPS